MRLGTLVERNIEETRLNSTLLSTENTIWTLPAYTVQHLVYKLFISRQSLDKLRTKKTITKIAKLNK